MTSQENYSKTRKRSAAFTDKIPAKEAPCQQACPAGIDVPRYVRLISQEKFDEALAVIFEKIPFPSVCARICTYPCEAECRLREMGGAIPIRALKRFVIEHAKIEGFQNRIHPKGTGKRVAIVGSGPAGLTAGYYLARKGHSVSVFERLSQPGGMLNLYPQFLLPQDVLKQEIESILSAGLDLKLKSPIAKAGELMQTGYQAVFIAAGAGDGKKLEIPGAELEGVIIGLSFLRDVNEKQRINLGEKIVVVGGGGVACDIARVVRRLGSLEVHMICPEPLESISAFSWEIEEAEKEGILIQPSRSVTKILGQNGQVIAVECVKLRWIKFNREGGLRLNPVRGSQHIINADTVIFAVGQMGTSGLVTGEGKSGRIAIKPDTMETFEPGVFAGGDVVTGPASVIEAISAGRKAACSIDRYLGGTGDIDERLVSPEKEVEPFQSPLPVPLGVGRRAEIPSLPIDQRLSGFAESEISYAKDVAIEQAKRCLRCDLPIVVDATKCNGCLTCQLRCSLRLEKATSPSKSAIQISPINGPHGESAFEISFMPDRCDTCGLCVKYCPTGALTR